MLDCDEAMMPGWKQAQIEETPMHRGADPVEIARAVVWLASDDASFITGQTLAIDGGVTAGGPALSENPLNVMSRSLPPRVVTGQPEEEKGDVHR